MNIALQFGTKGRRLERGLWRLWVVLSVIYIVVRAFTHFQYFPTASQLRIDAVNPTGQYPACESLAPEPKQPDDPSQEPAQPSDEELQPVVQCLFAAKLKTFFVNAATDLIGTPVVGFILGLAFLWVLRGFIDSEPAPRATAEPSPQAPPSAPERAPPQPQPADEASVSVRVEL
jgi:hypothetical protein